ncbi:MAG: hypothetical protein NVS3B20_25050 [Polyangiales bacterium]
MRSIDSESPLNQRIRRERLLFARDESLPEGPVFRVPSGGVGYFGNSPVGVVGGVRTAAPSTLRGGARFCPLGAREVWRSSFDTVSVLACERTSGEARAGKREPR